MEKPLATPALMTAILAPLAERPVETCAVLYLDAEGKLAGTRHVVGSPGGVALSVRTVAADALAFGASAAVMAHNHPSGDARPSEGDLAFTRRLARGLDALGVTLSEHVILTPGAMTSLRTEGYL